MIEAGASINALDNEQWSPLHHAAIWNPAAAPILLAAEAKVNLLDKWNSSPLCLAALNNQPASVIALLNAGGNPHLGYSPLTDFEVPKDIKDLIKNHSN